MIRFIRSLVSPALAVAAEVWYDSKPAFEHDTPGKQAVIALAIAAACFVPDLLLTIRKRAKARKAKPASAYSWTTPTAASRRR
jgi:uncharacterized protein (DUF169 family)